MTKEKIDFVAFGFGYKFGFNQFKNLKERCLEYVPLYEAVENLELVKKKEVDFYDGATDRTWQFQFSGKLADLEEVIRDVLKIQMPKILFSYRSGGINESSKNGYRLAKKILTEEFGMEPVDSTDVEYNFDFI